MNRYSRVTPSQFNPLSLQETFMVPLAKQQMQDQIVGQADQLGLFDINALQQDQPLVDNFTNNFRGKLDDLTNEIMSKGVDGMSKGKLRSLIAERRKFMEGQGAAVESNFNAYNANKAELDKLYQKGKISRDKYLRGLQSALGSYQGVEQGDSYNPFSAVQDVDFFKKAEDVAKAISNNPKKITQFSGLQYNPTTNKYIDTTTNREFTERDAIRQAVRARLKMDTDVMSDLQQREGLGMLGNTSVDKYIDGLGILNEAIYAKDNIKANRKFVARDRSLDDLNQETESPSFIYGSDRVMKLRDDKLADRLGRILEGGKIPGAKVSFAGGTGFSAGSIGLGNRNAGTVDSYEKMDGNLKTQYNELFNQLKRSGKIGDEVSGGSDEALQAVKGYLDEKRAKEFKFQPIKFTDGLVRGYDDRKIKMSTSTPEQIAKGISLNPADYKWIDDEKGKVMNTYDDLPKKYRQELLEGKARVSSVYSARNDFADKYGATVPEDILVAPMELQFSDGKKYLVSRPDGERQTRAYRVDHLYNRLWRDMAKYPDIDLPTNIPGIGRVNVQALMQPIVDEVGRELSIKITDEQGNVGYATQDQFEGKFKESYGIKQ